MHSRKLGRRTAVTMLGAATLLPSAGARAQQTWTAYTFAPAATIPPARAMAKLCEDLEKATNGQLVMKHHIAGALPINSTNITQAVSDDVVQYGDDGFFQGNVPIGGVMRLPMLINTREEFDKAAKVILPYLEAAYGKKGIIILGYYYFPLQVAWSRKKLTSLEDLKGTKMRVTSPEQGEFVRRFGGVPVTLGGAEVPSALDRGVVEGVFTAASGGGRVWKDLLKYSYDIGPNYFDAVLVVNKARFEKLPPDIQQKMRTLSAEAAAWNTATLFKEEDEVREQLKAAGMIMNPVNPGDVKAGIEKLTPYWDEWAKPRGAEAVKALAAVRAALGR